MDHNLVGKCGLYCGACSIYRAQRDHEVLRKQFAEKHHCSIEQVRCNGCGDLTSNCWGNGCKIVVCLRVKGLDYCFQCNEYENNSCSKHDKLTKSYLEVGVDLKANSERIKNGQTDDWLVESKNKFTCPNCNHPRSAWETSCIICGTNLNSLT